MTVISEPISNIAEADNDTDFFFSSPVLRESGDGTGMVTTTPILVNAVAGVLTTPDLDPGPTKVRIGLNSYYIVIPDSVTPVRLWPLILAGLPVPPAEEAEAVRNGGGVALITVLTEAEYAALTSVDPETLYVVVPNP
ncbi:hypothetical protein ACIBG0_39075 [Nocardia sp. NPDC050630]|uniref:phage upper tail fiber protein n=1 Tax=Nocardia sp. NPDC050630 TaxID=3364321 RepID=UPI003796D10F